MNELKMDPCPFCGGDPWIHYQGCRDKYHQGTKCIVFVKCETCKAQGGVVADDDYPNEDGRNWDDKACRIAIQKWNRRVK